MWNEEEQEWYFSVVDVVRILADQPDYQSARNYWKVTKSRLKKEGNETVTNCNQLKMSAEDGKRRLTDVANIEQIFRIIQSIPSPKAEPFKLWLAQVGAERIEETMDPEQTIDRAVAVYKRKGYSDEWIHQRLISILKGLKKENLRDNMTDLELVLNMLEEATTTELTRVHNPQGLTENQVIARRGGGVAGDARRSIEADIGRPVITEQNAVDFFHIKKLENTDDEM